MYLYQDHLGSTIYATHDGGTPISDQRYYPYGRKRSGGTLPTDHKFTGQKYSDANGLYYYGARYYDPELGTFISPDTLVPDPTHVFDYNRYMYTRGNPLKYNDPTGHCASNEDGSPNLVGADNEHCWGLVEQIYGYSGLPSFQADWKIPPQQWRETIANQEYATSEYLQPFADQYATEWRLWESAAGLSPATPRVLGDYNVTVHMPGQDMVGIVVDDVIECKRSWQDCGRVLDDASTALSSVAVGCGVTGFAPCAGVAAGTSTALSVVGTGLTIYGAWQGKSTWLDVGVATFTTGVGATVGAKPSDTQVVGFIMSVAQWAWDH